MKRLFKLFICVFVLVFAFACTTSNEPENGKEDEKEEITINITSDLINLKVGETYQIDYTVSKEVDLYFESSKNSVVSVTNTGELTAKKEGTVTIRVSLADNEDVYQEIIVNVVKTLQSLELTGTKQAYFGDTVQLYAVVPTGASFELEWASSDEAVLKVDRATGDVTLVGEGKATVTVTDKVSGLSASLEITVLGQKKIKSLNFTGGTEVLVNKELQLTAQYDNKIDVDLEWSSSDESILTVTDGVVTGVSAGSATVTLKDNISGLTASKEIIVLQPQSGDDIAEEVLEWAVAEVGDSGANEVTLPKKYDKYPTAKISWSSSDEVLFDTTEGLLDISDDDQTVEITCKVEYNGIVKEKTYTFTIISYVLYEVSRKFTSQFKNNSVYKDMNLNTSYNDYGGSTITWRSSDQSIFDNTGKLSKQFNDVTFELIYTVSTTSPKMSREFTIKLTAVGMNIGEKVEVVGEWLTKNVGNNGKLSQATDLPEYLEQFNAYIEWSSTNGSALDLSILAGNPILSDGRLESDVKVTIDGQSAKIRLSFETESVDYSSVWDMVQLFFDTITTARVEQFKYTLVTWTGNSYGYVPFINNNRIAIREEILPYTYGNQRTGIVKTSTEYIVCHDTGNASSGANAEMHRRYITNLNNDPNSTSISWHFVIDEDECIQHLPLNEVAWHAGDGSRVYGTTYYNTSYNAESHGGGNMNGIGIESCIHQGCDYTHVMLRYAKLVAGLLVDFKLGTDRVQQHNYFSGKNCPWVMRENNRWGEFMFLVKLEYFAMTSLKDVKFEWTSLSPIMNEEGRLFQYYDEGTPVSYQLSATYQGVTKTYTNTTKVTKR